MYFSVALLWIISSLMACWCFSVIVRTVSDWFAKKRNRLSPQYSRKSKWIALTVFLLCAATAYFAATQAIQFELDYNHEQSGISTPMGVISASVSMFAGFLLIWGIIGDRARGRTRCPRCWYDMSGATNLTCPECGNTVKSQSSFSKARRPKWPFILALIFLSTGLYAFSISKRVAETGEWLAAVPTWFLMLGWDRLPDEWIYNNWNSTTPQYESCLEDRLDSYWDEEWVSYERKAHFGNKLIKGMLGSPEERWDPIRQTLLDSVTFETTHTQNPETGSYMWTGVSVDLEFIARQCAIDMIEAVTAETPNKNQIRMMEVSFFDSAYQSVRELIKSEIEAQTGILDLENETVYLESKVRAKYSRILRDLETQICSDEFKINLIHHNEGRQFISFALAYDSGLIGQLYQVYFNTDDNPDFNTLQDRTFDLAFIARDLDSIEIRNYFNLLTEFLQSNDTDKLVFAITVLNHCQRMLGLNSNSEIKEYHAAYELAVEKGLNNHEMGEFLKKNPFAEPNDTQRTIHSRAIMLTARHDMTGQIAFPIIRQQLLENPETAIHINFDRDAPYESASVEVWLDNFQQFLDSESLEVQEWVINNLPEKLGTEFDERLDQIAVSFLDHPNQDFADTAKYKLERRLAEFLINH